MVINRIATNIDKLLVCLAAVGRDLFDCVVTDGTAHWVAIMLAACQSDQLLDEKLVHNPAEVFDSKLLSLGGEDD
ncbi:MULTISPECIES: hypothetical protein [Rhodobacterales]|uniref:hypothetical protein n=1 Tax=Rhodobacterales TaxID=204455 RepID=UPI0015937879|nr:MULTISPECIES: hypothetical protein [Rhodobacterales]MCD9147200.1 hypothetical protein [Pseudophaeobacter flagellatus]